MIRPRSSVFRLSHGVTERGKEPGDKAKNEILEEVTAFANAYGGVLFLGIDESEPRRVWRRLQLLRKWSH